MYGCYYLFAWAVSTCMCYHFGSSIGNLWLSSSQAVHFHYLLLRCKLWFPGMAYSSCWLYKGGCCYCYFKLVIFVVSIVGASAELQICQLVPAMHQAHLVSLCLLAVTTWKLWHTSEPSASHWMTRRYRWIQWSDVTEDINWCMLSWVAFLWRNPMVFM